MGRKSIYNSLRPFVGKPILKRYSKERRGIEMKVSKLVGSRFKERPADCVIDSHALMVRGGYMKNVGNGIYSEFPLLKRITAKIERIIRQEMDAIDGQEVLFPVTLP